MSKIIGLLMLVCFVFELDILKVVIFLKKIMYFYFFGCFYLFFFLKSGNKWNCYL